MPEANYYGVIPSDVKNVENRYRYSATASQTVFAAVYAIGFIDVYYGGLKLDPGAAFTAVNGTSITLTSPATAGVIVEIISRRQVAVVANTVPVTGGAMTGALALNGGGTSTTVTAGDSTTNIATTAFVQTAVAGTAQTLQNFTFPTRKVDNTTYTNATSKPIYVKVYASMVAAGTIAFTCNGSQVDYMTNNTGSGNTNGVSFLVPASATYSVSASGSPSFAWYEVR